MWIHVQSNSPAQIQGNDAGQSLLWKSCAPCPFPTPPFHSNIAEKLRLKTRDNAWGVGLRKKKLKDGHVWYWKTNECMFMIIIGKLNICYIVQWNFLLCRYLFQFVFQCFLLQVRFRFQCQWFYSQLRIMKSVWIIKRIKRMTLHLP